MTCAGHIGGDNCVVEAGHKVAVSDSSSSNSSAIAQERAQELAGRPLRFSEGDVRNRDDLGRAFEGSIDAVVHFAALETVGESCDQPLAYFDNNIGGTIDRMQAMGAHGVRQSAAIPEVTSRSIKPTSVGVPATRGEACTTWCLWPARSKFASIGSKGAATNAEADAIQDAFVLPSRRIAVPRRWTDSSSVPSLAVPPSSPTTGAVTRSWASAAIAIPLSRSGVTGKLPRPSCRSFTSCFPISRLGFVASITASAPQHLQAYFNEFIFAFNRCFSSFKAFRSPLGIAGYVTATTYAELYAKALRPTTDCKLGYQPDKHGCFCGVEGQRFRG